MSVIPCSQNKNLRKLIEDFSEVLKIEAHKLGAHGLAERDFYNSGLFRGAIERVRGQFSATMGPKREFARDILNYMQDHSFINDWQSSGENNRHDYTVQLPGGRVAVIELKGCMDGHNTVIYERPPHAQEFIVWSICTNTGGNPKLNAWSGIHTRIGADMLCRPGQRVDGRDYLGHDVRNRWKAMSKNPQCAREGNARLSFRAAAGVYLSLPGHRSQRAQ